MIVEARVRFIGAPPRRMPQREASATGPRPASTASGSTSSHGRSTKARSSARGCGSVEPLVGELLPAEVDEVEVERAVAPALVAHSAVFELEPLQHVEQRVRVECRLDDDDGVEVPGRRRVDAGGLDGRCLVHGRHRDELDALGARRARGSAAAIVASRSPRFAPNAMTARGSCPTSTRSSTDDIVAKRNRDGRLRLVHRDLDLVDRGPASATAATRSATVSMRSTGSLSTAATTALGELAVVHGSSRSSPTAAAARSTATDDVDRRTPARRRARSRGRRGRPCTAGR